MVPGVRTELRTPLERRTAWNGVTSLNRETLEIDLMRADDWARVAEIYREGIASGQATFAQEPPSTWEAWNAGKLAGCSRAARRVEPGREARVVAGWAALSPVSARAVYAGVAEVSIYVAAAMRGQGVGAALLEDLIRVSEAAGIWTLQAGIFPENAASLALHARCSFRLVGRREKLGRMEYGPLQGQWRDVLLLERRSSSIGII